MSQEFVLILWAFPDSVSVYGPMTESESIRMGELYRQQFPTVPMVAVELWNAEQALKNLPIEGKRQ